MKTLTFNLPVNAVSFGQTSTLLLRTIFDRIKNGADYQVNLFPIGGGHDLSAQKQDQEFEKWLNSCVMRAFSSHTKDNPIFKLWHLNGSLESFSKDQSLLSFYELDSPTAIELNTAKNSKTYFSSKYTCEVFESYGVKAGYIPLAFDSYNFYNTKKNYFSDDRIVFNICGKFEKRKHHAKAIKAWIKKFGNNNKYNLQCATYNPFMDQQQNNQVISSAILEGKAKPYNVNFLPILPKNEAYNDFLNSSNIVLGMSGGEGWGLPEFQSVALGKHAVILNASSYKDWANEENSVLIQPNGKEESYDGMFFQKGTLFNQGNIFTWNEDEFIAGCEKAIERVNKDRENKNGLLLQQEFNKEKFADTIIQTIQ
jgi:hypothetical protein